MAATISMEADVLGGGGARGSDPVLHGLLDAVVLLAVAARTPRICWCGASVCGAPPPTWAIAWLLAGRPAFSPGSAAAAAARALSTSRNPTIAENAPHATALSATAGLAAPAPPLSPTAPVGPTSVGDSVGLAALAPPHAVADGS